jgi:hypothetical protein
MDLSTLDSVTEKITNELNNNSALSRRSFLKLAGIGTAASFLGGCGKDPVDKTYAHGLTLNASDLINGADVSGEVIAIRERDNLTVRGNIGSRMDLGETKNSLENYTIQIVANGYLLREYTGIGISENTLKTNIIPNTADIEGMLANVNRTGMNASWVPREINVIYNAHDGERLTVDQKRGINDAMEYVKANSKGWITKITPNEGNNDINNTNIPEGQIWCFPYGTTAVSNATFPQGGDRVKSGRIFIGDEATSGRAFDETFDVFIQGEQNLGKSYDAGKLGDWFTIMFSRPRGNDNNYRLGINKETQKGIGNLTTNNATAQMTYVNNNSMFNPIGQTPEYNNEHVIRQAEGRREIERKQIER